MATSGETGSVDICGIRYDIKKFDAGKGAPDTETRVFLHASSAAWSQIAEWSQNSKVNQTMVRLLAAEIEDTYFWEEPDRVQLSASDDEVAEVAISYELPEVKREIAIVISTTPAPSAFDFGMSGGWYSLLSAAQQLQPGDAEMLQVGGAEVTVSKGVGDQVEISTFSDIEFDARQTPQPFHELAWAIGEIGNFGFSGEKESEPTLPQQKTKEHKRPPDPGESAEVPVGNRTVMLTRSSDSRTRGDRSKKIFRQAVEAAANDPRFGCDENNHHGQDKALGFLLVKHLRWSLLTSQGLGEFLTIEDQYCNCDAKAIKVCRKGQTCNVKACEKDRADTDSWDTDSWGDADPRDDVLHDERYWNQFEAVRQALDDRAHLYAFAASPKETVQRISEVAARRSTIELAALVSTLQTGAKIDNVTELVLDSQRILHGIARQPLVVGFTHGLHFANSPHDDAMSAKAAQAGWMIGPKFHISEAAWTPPWSKGFGYRHTPVQNNLSVAISVPSWWEHAEVAVTTYWRSLKNKTKGEPRRHRHRIELPGTTAGITNALIEHQLPEVFEPRIRGAPAKLLLIGDNLWRSTRVTLGGQVAEEITVLPALAGLVAHFKKVDELASPDGKRPRKNVLIHVWTSTGKRLAGVATVYPAEAAKQIEPKLALAPPYFVKGGSISAKLTAGDVPKAERVEMQARVLDEEKKVYGPPIDLGVPKLDAATKTYTVEPGSSAFTKLGDKDVRVRILLVITPKTGGKIETISCEKLGVYYASKPTISWKNPEKTDGELTLTTPSWTDIAFPDFTTKTGVKVEAKAPPELGTVELKNSIWSTASQGRFELKSFLGFDPPVSAGEKVKIQPVLTDAGLKKLLPIALGSGSKEEITVH